MIVLLLVLSIFGATVRVGAAQESDRRTFGVVSHSTGPAVSSVYVQLRDDLLGAADRSAYIAVYRLADSLYLRVIPQGDRTVERGVFAYFFSLSRDAAGNTVLHPTNQSHGVTEDAPRAWDFRRVRLPCRERYYMVEVAPARRRRLWPVSSVLYSAAAISVCVASAVTSPSRRLSTARSDRSASTRTGLRRCIPFGSWLFTKEFRQREGGKPNSR
jgi:hypothetical protein